MSGDGRGAEAEEDRRLVGPTPSRGTVESGPAGRMVASHLPGGLSDPISGAVLQPDRPLIWRRTVPLGWEFELIQDSVLLGEMDASEDRGTVAWGVRSTTVVTRPDEVASGGADPPGAGPSFRGHFVNVGRIRSGAGERLLWRRSLIRMYDNILRDSTGAELLRLRPAFLRFGGTETKVMLSEAGRARPDIAHLILLCWFLWIQGDSFRVRLFGRFGRRRRDETEPF